MNKLGFYTQTNQGVHEWISTIQPPVLLIHAWDQGLLEEIRQFRSPDTFVIGRMDYIGPPGNQIPVRDLVNQWLDSDDPAGHGRAFAEHILSDNSLLAQRRHNGRLLVDAWMSLNESVPGPASEAYKRGGEERAEIERRLRAYDAFQVAFRNKLQEHGIEAVAFNFGAGNFAEANHYLEHLPGVLDSYTYLGFHEYGWPAMSTAVDPAAVSSAGSYRAIMNGIRARKDRSYKVIITEAGLARMFKVNDGAGDVGWLHPTDSVSQDHYWRSLDWYNDFIVQDDYVIGACLFQVGHGGGWESFRHIGDTNDGQPISILERVRHLREKVHPVPVVVGGPPHPAPVVNPVPQPVPPAAVDISNGHGNGLRPEDPGLPVLDISMGNNGKAPGVVPVAEKLGIDANRPINPDTGQLGAQVADPGLIAETGVGWVRINFVLGRQWQSVDDPGWQETYRRIVNGFRGRGLKIYGLVSDEAMRDRPGDRYRNSPPHDAGADDWIRAYANTVVSVMRTFQHDVAAFETFNEPDDWHEGQSNWIHPGWYAILLQTVYALVKAEPAIRDLTLVSGPLQGLHNEDGEGHHNNNGGAKYLRSTYQEGKARFDWGGRSPFPFDGVGYHLYVAQASFHNDEQIRQKYDEYMGELRQVIREAEGRHKPIYLSEFGWPSNRGHEDFQRRAMQTGLNLALNDDSLALVIWFCTQDFDPEERNKWYGLFRKDGLSMDHRKPVHKLFCGIARETRQVAAAGVSVPVVADVVRRVPAVLFPRIFTNQHVINAAAFAAERLGLANPWSLLERLNQDVGVLARDDESRTALYAGPFPNGEFTAQERGSFQTELLGQALSAVRWTGLVNSPSAGLNLRAGPGTEHDVLSTIPHEELLQVLDDRGEWYFVVWGNTPGYVHSNFVLRRRLPVSSMVKAPTRDNQTALRETWQKHRSLLKEEAQRLGIDPGVAVAVLLAESQGTGFSADGRMIVRFENHIFFQEWGQQNQARFARHFEFSDDEWWKEHRWRPSPLEVFQPCHVSQVQEWSTLSFARTLSEEAALRSISMGMPQIMGFNHQVLGYGSAREMFDAFQENEEVQIRGLFRFIERKNAVAALYQGDFLAFATIYNGSGQAENYRNIIQRYLDLFHETIQESLPGSVPIGAPDLPPAQEKGIFDEPPFELPEPEEVEHLPMPVPKLPMPASSETLRESDPDLYDAWKRHMQQGFQNNQAMFDQVLKGFMNPYWTTVWMYRVLFAVGILSFIAAIVFGYLGATTPGANSAVPVVIFGGLSAVTFLSYFLSKPLQALEENLQLITWLGIVYNSYWTRLVYASDPETVQDEIDAATDVTIEKLKDLIATHKDLSSNRPGLR